MAEARRSPNLEWQRIRRRRSKPSTWSGLLIGALLTIFLIILSYTGYLLYVWARSALTLQAPGIAGSIPQSAQENREGVQVGSDGQLTDYGNSQDSGIADPRINVLILGVDQRPGEGEATRADTIIVVTVDPATGQAGMISIPRDLYVTVPGYGERKINTAYFLGGPKLAKQTVEQFLGYEIDYYVKINFDGFKYLLDLIGGIYIDVPQTIYDAEFPDDNYSYDPFYLKAGRHHMDGETALKYARVRNIDNDYGRARRQQQVLLAIKDQLFQRQMIAVIAKNIVPLYNRLINSVSSDVPLSQIPALLELANKVDLNHIAQLVIDDSMGLEYNGEETGWILIPDPVKVRPAVDAIFNPPPPSTAPAAEAQPTAAAVPSIAEQLAAEGARIQVLNGAGVEHLATDTSAWLRSQGFNVVDIGNADQSNYTHSIITDYTGKQFTIQQLARLFNVSQNNIRVGASLGNNIDIRLIIGQDFRIPTP